MLFARSGYPSGWRQRPCAASTGIDREDRPPHLLADDVAADLMVRRGSAGLPDRARIRVCPRFHPRDGSDVRQVGLVAPA